MSKIYFNTILLILWWCHATLDATIVSFWKRFLHEYFPNLVLFHSSRERRSRPGRGRRDAVRHRGQGVGGDGGGLRQRRERVEVGRRAAAQREARQRGIFLRSFKEDRLILIINHINTSPREKSAWAGAGNRLTLPQSIVYSCAALPLRISLTLREMDGSDWSVANH